MSGNLKEATVAFITSMAQKKEVLESAVTYMTAMKEKKDQMDAWLAAGGFLSIFHKDKG
jgi:hypothetical protein